MGLRLRGLPVDLYNLCLQLVLDTTFTTQAYGFNLLFDLEDLVADPLGDGGRDSVTNESPSTAVQPSGNPISFSHSSHVKFLATQNWSVAMAALMSARLSANRGAKILCFGIPKASPTLNQKWSVCCSPRSKVGSSVLPPRASRRRIPVAAAAVRKELIGGFGSMTCDNEYSLSVVGQTRIESVAREPAPQIPDFFKLVGNCFKRCSVFRAEESDNIFQDKPSRPYFRSKLDKIVEEPAAFAFKAFSVCVGMAEILAWPATSPDFGLRDVF